MNVIQIQLLDWIHQPTYPLNRLPTNPDAKNDWMADSFFFLYFIFGNTDSEQKWYLESWFLESAPKIWNESISGGAGVFTSGWLIIKLLYVHPAPPYWISTL